MFGVTLIPLLLLSIGMIMGEEGSLSFSSFPCRLRGWEVMSANDAKGMYCKAPSEIISKRLVPNLSLTGARIS